MENTSSPYYSETGSDKIKIFLDLGLSELPKNLDPEFLIVENDKEADILCLKKDKKIHFEIRHPSLPFKKVIDQSLFLQFLRRTKKFFTLKTLTPETSFKRRTHYKNSFFDLDDNIPTDYSLTSFVKSLFNQPFFQEFTSIHTFTHHKGMVVSNYNLITKNGTKESIIDVKEFTQLFNAIKKSKNGSFGQASLKAANFKIIGTCLAKEFTFQEHSFIFILSKDDFLPQKNEDIEEFQRLVYFLSFFFKYLLTMETYINQNATNESLLGNDLQNIISYSHNSISSADVNHRERVALLGELLNTLRHELSNPLFGLQLSIDLIDIEQLDEDSSEFVTEMKKAINQCQNILSSFSDLYLNTSKQENTDFLKLLREVITLTKSRSKHIKKIIMVNGDEILKDQELFINTNKTFLAQVLFNLIINSTQAFNEKFPNPEIQISITKDDAEKRLSILFSDNGPGVPIQEAENLFKPFYTTKEDGTGLGLSISRELCRKLNGDIKHMESDKGACFLIELPL